MIADRLLEGGFSDEEIQTMTVEQTREAGRMSRRVLVIGAHAADFVWRAGGAIAVATRNGGTAQVIALSYGERGESGELWKQPDQTIENVKRVRHAEAEKAAAALGAEFRALDFGDYPLEVGPERLRSGRRRDPRVRARRADHPHRHRPVQPRSSRSPTRSSQRARSTAAGAGVASAFDSITPAGPVPVRAPPAGAVQLHADDVRGHHAR